jgi:hypothetical protein
MIRRQLLAFAGLAFSACAGPAFSDNPPADAKPSMEVAWLVIGVQPDTARLGIFETVLKNGVVRNFHYSLDEYHPVDGFIVVKARPGMLYGIAVSSLMHGHSIFGTRYEACGRVPTFQAGAGEVVYVTTIAYRAEGVTSYRFGVINMAESSTFSQDFNAARDFLKAHYPGLSDSLEQGRYDMTPLARQCAR